MALLLGGVMGFGIGELGLRWFRPQRTGPFLFTYDAQLGAVPVPNGHGRVTIPGVYSFWFSHDSNGFRNIGVVNRAQAEIRILLLGDSFTYGLGVDDRETFASKLEAELAARGLSAAVINAGNPNTGTDYALRLFETRGAALKPTLTLLGFHPNDFRDNARNRFYTLRSDGTLVVRPRPPAVHSRWSSVVRFSSVYNWLISWSHAANLVRQLVISTQERSESERTNPDVEHGFSNQENTRLTKVLLDRLATTVKGAGSDFAVLYLPGTDEVAYYRETGRIPPDEQAVRAFVLAPQFLGSLTPVLATTPQPLIALYYDEWHVGRPQGHWTPLANSIVAEYIARLVISRLERR